MFKFQYGSLNRKKRIRVRIFILSLFILIILESVLAMNKLLEFSWVIQTNTILQGVMIGLGFTLTDNFRVARLRSKQIKLKKKSVVEWDLFARKVSHTISRLQPDFMENKVKRLLILCICLLFLVPVQFFMVPKFEKDQSEILGQILFSTIIVLSMYGSCAYGEVKTSKIS